MKNFTVFGYARTKLTDEELRNMISQTLTCRIDKRFSTLPDHFPQAAFCLSIILFNLNVNMWEDLQRKL